MSTESFHPITDGSRCTKSIGKHRNLLNPGEEMRRDRTNQRGQGHDGERTQIQLIWARGNSRTLNQQLGSKKKQKRKKKKKPIYIAIPPFFFHCNLVMSSHVIFYLFDIKSNLCSTQLSLIKCARFPWCCISITSDNFLIKRISSWVNLEM